MYREKNEKLFMSSILVYNDTYDKFLTGNS